MTKEEVLHRKDIVTTQVDIVVFGPLEAAKPRVPIKTPTERELPDAPDPLPRPDVLPQTPDKAPQIKPIVIPGPNVPASPITPRTPVPVGR